MKRLLWILFILLFAANGWAGTWGSQASGISTSADIIAFFASGSCSGYLKSDGTCDTPTGAGDLLSTNNLSDLTNAATARTNLGLVIGTDVQAYIDAYTTITALWASGACSGYLKSDGTCDLPTGFDLLTDTSPQLGGDLSTNGSNIIMTGTETVDGRDLSADGTRLDTMEDNAAADQSASDVPITDIAGNLIATDVEGAIAEIFPLIPALVSCSDGQIQSSLGGVWICAEDRFDETDDYSTSGTWDLTGSTVILPLLTLDPYDANWSESQLIASQGDVYTEMEQKADITSFANQSTFESNYFNLPDSIAELTDWPSGLTITELSYVDGATSNIQDQIDSINTGSVTVQSADPTSASSEGFYGATTSGDFFYKSSAGLFNISSGTYTADPVPPSAPTMVISGSGPQIATFSYAENITANTTADLCDDWSISMTSAGSLTLGYSSGDTTTTIVCSIAEDVFQGDTVASASYTQGTIQANDDNTLLASIADFSGSITNSSTESDGLTSLDTGSTYGQNTQRMYLFDNGSGTTVTDYSPSDVDATLTGGYTWESDGITIDGLSELITTTMPTIGTTGSIMIVFTSTTTSGTGPSSELSRLYGTSSVDDDLALWRNNSDTQLYGEISTVTVFNDSVSDLWDTTQKVVLVTWNDTNNTLKAYVNGTLDASGTITYDTGNITSTSLMIGNRADGQRPIMATVHAFYMWTTEFDSTAASALASDYMQMFNNPPTR